VEEFMLVSGGTEECEPWNLTSWKL
jgi:hypothetical protein